VTPLRIVFLGSDAIALPLLDWLAGEGSAQATLAAVFTQPDRPAGRGQKVEANAIKRWALVRNLPVIQPEKLAEAERTRLAELGADVALVMAYGHILRDDFIATPRLGTLNLHASLLPAYRGASPIQTAIASGERETGVTLMRIVKKLDAGPVADAERVAIAPRDTAAEVEAKLAAACVPLLARALPKLVRGELVFGEQNHAAAGYCRRLEKADGALDFAATAAVLAARINGLFPWPGCTVEIAGESIKLGLAEAVATPGPAAVPSAEACNIIRYKPSFVPGEVLGADEAGLRVATGEGGLRLLRLQRPGGRMLAAPEFLRGFQVAPGTVLPSHPMRPLTGPAPFR